MVIDKLTAPPVRGSLLPILPYHSRKKLDPETTQFHTVHLLGFDQASNM